MKKTYHYSHSVVQGGFMFIQKSDNSINIETVTPAVNTIIEKYQLIDTTIKIHDDLLFLFFAPPRKYAPQHIIDAIQESIKPLGEWDTEHLLVTVDDVQEDSVKKELARLGITDEPTEQQREAPKNIAPIILSTIKQLLAGRAKIALFLAGSKAADILPLQTQQGYGGLFWYNARTIEGFLTQLEKQEYITTHIVKTPEYSYPILILTEKGEHARKEQQEIPLLNVRLAPKLGESEEQTYVLFKQGKNPQQIAETRELALSTICDHFIKLIDTGKISATQIINSHVIKKVLQARSKFIKEPRLKEIKEILPDVSYTEIRCVLADRTLHLKK